MTFGQTLRNLKTRLASHFAKRDYIILADGSKRYDGLVDLQAFDEMARLIAL